MKRMETTLRNVYESTPQPNKQAVTRILCVFQKKRLAALQVKRLAYIEATFVAPPTFSWCMPEASHPNVAIQQFLRGPQHSATFKVGGGITNARRIGGLQYRSDSGHFVTSTQSTTVAVSGSGSAASVTVTKTEEYHTNKVKKYNADAKELLRIDEQIRRLRCESDPTPQVLVEVSENLERPAKKAKVLVPIPEGSEVITID